MTSKNEAFNEIEQKMKEAQKLADGYPDEYNRGYVAGLGEGASIISGMDLTWDEEEKYNKNHIKEKLYSSFNGSNPMLEILIFTGIVMIVVVLIIMTVH